MASRSIIDEPLGNRFNEANACHKADKLLRSIEFCYKLLDEPILPRLHKMMASILLGATARDWDEVIDCLVAAESLWKIERRWNPEGGDETLDVTVEDRKALESRR